MDGVTIMSVYYSPETRMLQELNKSLTDRLNPGSGHKWLFAENSKEKTKINPVQFSDANAKVLPGVAGWREDVVSFFRGSFNHAGGLQILLKNVDTRFVICTEPDFFIIRPNWISELVDTMEAKKLSFFGAPYDPRRYNMYRYFPHVAFMAMDLSRMDKSTLDFNPNYIRADFLHRVAKKIIGRRANINTRRDTGSKIFEQYHKTRASECIQPVFTGKMSSLDKILPDSFSFIPHKKDYFVTEGFLKYGLPDFRNLYKWEEYFYRGRPYAFHMQGSKEKKDMARESAIVKEFIEKIVSNLRK